MHLCSLRSNGNPYYMFFTLYNDIPIIYFIDKKIHPGYQKPRILIVRGLFDAKLYQNTLIDGEMVKCNNGKWIFLFNDIIAYEGKHLHKTTLPDRLKILYELLDTQHTIDPVIDVCQYKIKTYYHVCKESIDALIDMSKLLNYTCRGIYMWSYDIRYKPKLYNFNEDNIVSVVRKVKDETEFKLKDDTVVHKITETTHNTLQTHADNFVILWLAQTEYPDVYNLYQSENMLTSKNIGTALIPNMHISKLMRTAFKSKNAVHIIKVKCLFNDVFGKWYPIEIM